MRKKRIAVCVVLLIAVVLLTSCGANPAIQEATGTTARQSKRIEHILAGVDLVCSTIEASNNPLTKDMDNAWKAYDIVGEDNNFYLLILRKSDNDFTAVINSDGEVLLGLVDNGVLPAYFADRS